MSGQPPIIWHRAEGASVWDKWGNRWIDWSSGVLITNAGHGRKEIRDALKSMIDQELLATYVFPHEGRATLTHKLRMVSPDPENYQAFLLSTGSEATENCIKLARPMVWKNTARTRNISSRSITLSTDAPWARSSPAATRTRKNGSASLTRLSCRSRSRRLQERRHPFRSVSEHPESQERQTRRHLRA